MTTFIEKRALCLDSISFRRVMSHFASGVAVVTTCAGGKMHGMTCNAFCSVSISPATILVSLAKNTRTEKLTKIGKIFAVNILSDGQTWLSDRFAGRHPDQEENRFNGVEYTIAATGAPILKGAQAYVDCYVRKRFDCETHTVFWGTAAAIDVDETQQPLIFFGSRYMAVDNLKALTAPPPKSAAQSAR